MKHNLIYIFIGICIAFQTHATGLFVNNKIIKVDSVTSKLFKRKGDTPLSTIAYLLGNSQTIKMDPLALIFGNLSLAIELKSEQKKCVEFGIVLYSVGLPKTDLIEKMDGFLFRLCFKRVLIKKLKMDEIYGELPSNRFYFRKDIFLMKRSIMMKNSEYASTYNGFSKDEKFMIYDTGFGMVFNIGYEAKLGQNFMLDAFCGMGGGFIFDQIITDPSKWLNYFQRQGMWQGISMPSERLSSAFQAGIKIGYTIKTIKK